MTHQIKLYNTLTRQKEVLTPSSGDEILMYGCGPTVYNYFHIGNARMFIVFDAMRRYFEYRGYKVRYVQNFTDIDDKMIQRAREENTTVREVADKYIAEYWTDAKGLGVQPATVHPRATESMDDIIDIIAKLIEGGHAYVSDGDVYFAARSFPSYGKLSGINIDDLESGARIDVSEIKRDPLDFALWKKQKPDEPAWESPWSLGRPGWHIECSAMARHYLGETIDIHCGGPDLVFPHHENEIAQSECASGKQFARFWVHNGYINVDSKKMSKSEGNFFMVRDAAKAYGYMPVRFFLLAAHYRSPINFVKDSLVSATASLERIFNCRDNLRFRLKEQPTGLQPTGQALSAEEAASVECHRTAFTCALDDDFNTADAIGVLFELVREANSAIAEEKTAVALLHEYLKLLEEFIEVLGFTDEKQPGSEISPEILELVEKRTAAKKARDFAAADSIRDRLKEMGVTLEDTPQGVKINVNGR